MIAKKSAKDRKSSSPPSKREKPLISEDDKKLFLDSIENIDEDEILSQKQLNDNNEKAVASKSGSPKTRPIKVKIDLHGKTLESAILIIDAKFNHLLASSKGKLYEITIITGKGRHSPDRDGVLAKNVHRYVVESYQRVIRKIDDSPDNVRLDGLPIRGHFTVTIGVNR